MTEPSMEVSRRRRIQRACDQCRRRKTRCDGGVHCEPCANVGLRCSYGSRAEPTSGPRYIARLENKVGDLENQLRRLSTSMTSSEQDGTPNSQEATIWPDKKKLVGSRVDSVISMPMSLDGNAFRHFGQGHEQHWSSNELVEILGLVRQSQGSLDGHGVSIHRGRTTGVEILRNLRDLCDSFTGSSHDSARAAIQMVSALDYSAMSDSFPLLSLESPSSSPKAAISRWINIAFDEAFILWPFIHREDFLAYAKQLSDRGALETDAANGDLLELFNAVIALGQRHDPYLVSAEGKRSDATETRGLEHFAAAQQLVPLATCSRSVTAVQTVLCMALYLKSVSAQRAVHSYISTACYAAHQLGLHEAAETYCIAEKEVAVKQRVYAALRIFDAYNTSSLGLPRNLHPIKTAENTTYAPYLGRSEDLVAANANVELLEIFNDIREQIYFRDVVKTRSGSTMVNPKQLQDFDVAMGQWAQKYDISASTSVGDLASSTKAHMYLKYSRCFVILVLHCPLLHHITKPVHTRLPSAYAAASRCVEAAIQAVRVAEALNLRDMLHEGYALTVDVLAMAATALLVVELGAPHDSMMRRVRTSSRTARSVLEALAQHSCSAARCLCSLSPLYERTALFPQGTVLLTEQVSEDLTSASGSDSDPAFWDGLGMEFGGFAGLEMED